MVDRKDRLASSPLDSKGIRCTAWRAERFHSTGIGVLLDQARRFKLSTVVLSSVSHSSPRFYPIKNRLAINQVSLRPELLICQMWSCHHAVSHSCPRFHSIKSNIAVSQVSLRTEVLICQQWSCRQCLTRARDFTLSRVILPLVKSHSGPTCFNLSVVVLSLADHESHSDPKLYSTKSGFAISGVSLRPEVLFYQERSCY